MKLDLGLTSQTPASVQQSPQQDLTLRQLYLTQFNSFDHNIGDVLLVF